jgi:hypothetical protein
MFSVAARAPIQKPLYEGQPCCMCGNRTGEMVFVGYDEVLGELWQHIDCKAVTNIERQAIRRMAIGEVHQYHFALVFRDAFGRWLPRNLDGHWRAACTCADDACDFIERQEA